MKQKTEMIRYLHLSDLHLTAVGNKDMEDKDPEMEFNPHVVTRSMLEKIRESDFQVDFVVITGDIAQSGRAAEYEVCKVFCTQLLEALNLPRDRLFLVPGNHDVDRGKITGKQIKSVYDFEVQDDITETLTDPDFFPILMRKFKDFNGFAEAATGCRRFDQETYWYTERLDIEKSGNSCAINLVGLNSCLFAGYDGDEKEKLALGLFQVEKALENLEKGDLSICFFHHPFKCFHPKDKVCRNELMKRLDLILTGHLHDPDNAFIRDAAGQALIIGAGAGYESRESRNSFNIVEIDPATGEGRIQFFKYLPDHNLWKVDTDINPAAEDGSFTFRIGGEIAETEPSQKPPSDTNGPMISPDDLERFYLKRLINRCDPLELAAIEESCLTQAEDARSIRVSDVYTTLYIKDIKRMPDETVEQAIWGRLQGKDGMREHLLSGDREEREKEIPIQAVAAAGAMPRVVILGQPGGGKSTLVNHMAAQLARLRLGDAEAILLEGWEGAEKPLPVRIILREFAAWLNHERRKDPEGLVWEYLRHQFGEWECGDFFPAARKILDQHGGVIFFDGLDEVSEADEASKRRRILEAVRAFAGSLSKCRVLITCREYAYQKRDVWRLPDASFPVLEIDLFREDQVEAFIHTWYRETGDRKGRTVAECEREAADLAAAVKAMPHLRELAPYPLLLTLMAIVHGGKGLPQDRADLYERAIMLLLAHWENRIVRDPDGVCRVEPSVIMRLGLKIHALREPLERIALAAHERQEKERENRTGCADIFREDLREELSQQLDGSLDRAEEVIEYIQHRAGLLQAKDNRTFSFPHRTFQEYLAATGVIRRSDLEFFLRDCIVRDISWWREVFLLAAAGASRNTPKYVFDMVDTLLPDDPDGRNPTPEIIQYARLAAQAMGETGFLRHVASESPPGRYARVRKRVQEWLLIGITADDVLSASERCRAGDAINWVGDPRFDPDHWYLPNEEMFGFVKIPAGHFSMGTTQADAERLKEMYRNAEVEVEGKDIKVFDLFVPHEMPQHDLDLPEFYLAKYPVTKAQFRAFVLDSGYETDGKWAAYGHENHPVVMVSWYDADEYCRWLTEKLKDKGWEVTLPTEAQWEKVARGGSRGMYPWGDSIEPNKANYRDAGIGETSPVDCFPGGDTAFGISDVIGNVWEWTRSLWGTDIVKADFGYPYDAHDGREDMSSGASRVLRGGAWDFPAELCRAAFRNRYVPGYRSAEHGFRLALRPGRQAQADKQGA